MTGLIFDGGTQVEAEGRGPIFNGGTQGEARRTGPIFDGRTQVEARRTGRKGRERRALNGDYDSCAFHWCERLVQGVQWRGEIADAHGSFGPSTKPSSFTWLHLRFFQSNQ